VDAQPAVADIVAAAFKITIAACEAKVPEGTVARHTAVYGAWCSWIESLVKKRLVERAPGKKSRLSE
jgi:hypothetical protein